MKVHKGEQKQTVIAMYKSGYEIAKITEFVDVDRSSIYRWLDNAGVPRDRRKVDKRMPSRAQILRENKALKKQNKILLEQVDLKLISSRELALEVLQSVDQAKEAS
tara:strand:- start:18887 stop:19204 length:318 start_codon:yes stop_codon:yes gene_type:complete